MNKTKIQHAFNLDGDSVGAHYGCLDGAQFCTKNKPDETILLSLAKFCSITGAITDIVEASVNDLIAINPGHIFTISDVVSLCYEKYGVTMKPGSARGHLHKLRCSGKIENLIAGNNGYRVAKDSAEVRKYLDSLQLRAMQIHDLQAAIKYQAEKVFGHQMEIPIK